MSLTRAALLARPRAAHEARCILLRRSASSGADSHGHDDHHPQDNFEYPPERGFTTPLYRNLILGALAIVGWYKFAPGQTDDNALTRYLASTTRDKSFWAAENLKHMQLSKQQADNVVLVTDAKRPPIHRLRNPLVFEHGSPHSNPVGMTPDLTGVVVKKEGE